MKNEWLLKSHYKADYPVISLCKLIMGALSVALANSSPFQFLKSCLHFSCLSSLSFFPLSFPPSVPASCFSLSHSLSLPTTSSTKKLKFFIYAFPHFAIKINQVCV